MLCLIFWELGKKRELKKKNKKTQTQKIPDSFVNEDSEEEEVKPTIYNSAEERRKFYLLTIGMEEEFEEVEEEIQDSEYDGYSGDG